MDRDFGSTAKSRSIGRVSKKFSRRLTHAKTEDFLAQIVADNSESQ